MKKFKKLALMLSVSSLLLAGCGAKGLEQKSASTDAAVKVGIIQYMDHVSLDQARQGFIDEMKKAKPDVEVEVQNEQGDSSLTSTVPKKFESKEYSLVYTIATPAAQGAKNALPDKNIIFAAVSDPVGAGLVKDLNTVEKVTGVSDYIDPKGQLETFLKLYPNVKRIGTIYSTSEQNSQAQIERLKKATEELGLTLNTVGVSNINDIPQAIASLSSKMDALFALTDNTVASAAPIVAENLIKYNIPSISAEEGQVKNGLLMSEGVDYYQQGAQAARMAVKILDGADPKTLPVEFNEQNVKKVNKKMAESLKLDLNSEVFKGAEIIE